MPYSAPKYRLSPLLWRILAINIIALAVLVAGLLYLGHYQERIIATQLDAMTMQSRIISSAVAEDAVVIDERENSILSPMLARFMIKRLAETTETRTRLFNEDDTLLADSLILIGPPRKGAPKASTPPSSWFEEWGRTLFDHIDLMHERHDYPLYIEEKIQKGSHYDIVTQAMDKKAATQVWRLDNGELMLAVATPVVHSGKVVGAVMLTYPDKAIDYALYSVRIDILKIFCMSLLVTTLLSLYLARTIAHPIRQLALAAERMRLGQTQRIGMAGSAKFLEADTLPDFTRRGDEIGELSASLRSLTKALAQRLSAIEHFAADVAHELKNPLTSLRSAVETVGRVQDPAAHEKLLAVIRHDVDRMDRLISDISNASRLDAELGRSMPKQLELEPMLCAIIAIYRHQPACIDKNITIMWHPLSTPVIVMGTAARLAQVFQNVIDNALSFSPNNSTINITVQTFAHHVAVTVDDSGSGIPPNNLDNIFERFYSERPSGEMFGMHSGLGLSIAKQIIEAHNGTITASNRTGETGDIIGARFTITLPTVAG